MCPETNRSIGSLRRTVAFPKVLFKQNILQRVASICKRLLSLKTQSIGQGKCRELQKIKIKNNVPMKSAIFKILGIVIPI